jgi:hypothetical protein
MRDFQKITSNFYTPPHPSRIRQDFVELGAFELISAFATWEMMGSCSKLSSREKWFPGTKSQIADRKIADRLYGNSYENFQSAGLPHNFYKNYRLQLKLAVSTRLDVSYNL